MIYSNIKKIILLNSIVFLCLLILSLVSEPSHCGWRDRAKQKFNSTREKVRERVNTTREKIRETRDNTVNRVKNSNTYNKLKDKTRESYNKYKPVVTNKIKNTVNNGINYTKQKVNKFKNNDRTKDVVNSLKNKFGSVVKSKIDEVKGKYGSTAITSIKTVYDRYGSEVANKFISTYRNHGHDIATRVKDVYAKHGKKIGIKVHNIVDQTSGNIKYYAKSKMNDPEFQEKALKSVVKTAVFINKFPEHKKKITKRAIQYAADNIIIEDKYGNKSTMNDFTSNWIVTKAPYLAGTSIANDPVEAFTYVIIYKDVDYIANDMKIVKNDNGSFCSLTEKATQISPVDVNQSLKIINVVSSFETLTDEESSVEDIGAAIEIIETVNDISNTKGGKI